MKSNKKGISLIVLVITIIVMIILATAIILSLNSSNLTSKTNWAKISSDRANLQEEYATIHSNLVASGKENITVDDVTSLPEYVAWEAKVKAAGFEVEIPENINKPARIKVVLELSEAELEEYGLEYNKEKNKVKGYNWVRYGKQVVKVDGVVIPEEFTASIYEGEMTKEEGLVIYETSSLNGIDQETAMTTYNQYVWIPVPDMAEFVRRDGYGLLGELQTYVSNENVTEPFSKGTLSAANDLTGEHSEYAAMKASVEKYGGFYIARYEAGTIVQRTDAANGTSYKADGTTPDVLSQKYKYPYNYVGWGSGITNVEDDVTYRSKNQGKGAVVLSRNMYKSSSSVVSTLCYGVQWDAVMKFMKDVENPNVEGKKYMENSTGMGWYYNNYSSGNAEHKTGIDVDENKSNMVKNVYDMAGNVAEWTMEAYDESYRIARGGDYSHTASNFPASRRGNCYPNETYGDDGFRVALYLK